jgi:Ca-activated chloride channel homolog
MEFEYPWALLLLPLIAGWAFWEWRNGSRIPHLWLRTAVVLSIALALASPVWELPDSSVHVVALADISDSVGEEGLAETQRIIQRLEREGGARHLTVLPFGNRVLPADGTALPPPAARLNVAGGTNIEAAMRHGLAALPARSIPRLVLISDGLENAGSMLRATWKARALGIPVHVYGLPGRPVSQLLIRNLEFPDRVWSGERFPLRMTVETPTATRARVEITVDGKRIGLSEVNLEAGLNPLLLTLSVQSEGTSALRADVSADGLGSINKSGAITFRRPRAIFVTSTSREEDANLLNILSESAFQVRVTDGVPSDLDETQLLVLNNQDMEAYPEPLKERIEQYVTAGGGLLVVAGERNVYVEKAPDVPEDALARTLPAKLAPPQSEEGTAVVLIIDKSSSMEGRKMQLARVATIGVIDHLRDQDMVGVLIFDNSHQWAVPIRKAESRTMIKRLVSGIMADGGTQIAPALEEAYRRIYPVKASFKHIVLLTDGISEEGDSINLASEAQRNQVTISTVGLGRDVNRNYLQKVADTAGGSAYFVEDANMLQQIMLKDVMDYTGSTAIEGVIKAQQVRQSELLDGVNIASAPPLGGFVKFEAKPSADLLLTVDREDAPLLARWQYGLGRAAVFTSDAKGRWASEWLTWDGYDRLWANLARDLLPRSQPREATIRFDEDREMLLAEYRTGSASRTQRVPDLFLFGPENYRMPLRAEQVTPGLVRVEAPTGERRGLFRIRPVEDLPDFPELGYYVEEEEVNDFGNDERLLQEVATYTGGSYNPPPGSVFDPGNVRFQSATVLWPFLIALAIFLQLLELFLRKGLPWLRERRQAQAANLSYEG